MEENNPRQNRPWRTLLKVLAYTFLFVLILVSLALNVLVIASLLEVRQTAAGALNRAAGALADMEATTFETSVEVRQTIPVNAEIPFQREWNVPVRVSVPIEHELAFEETIVVPIDVPLFELNLDVPVSTTIPVSLTVPIETEVPFAIDETFYVDTEVQVDLLVPVTLDLADTSLPAQLDALAAMLEGVQEDIEGPVRPNLEIIRTLWE